MYRDWSILTSTTESMTGEFGSKAPKYSPACPPATVETVICTNNQGIYVK